MDIISVFILMTLFQTYIANSSEINTEERVRRLEELIRGNAITNDERFAKLEALVHDQSVTLREQAKQMVSMRRTLSVKEWEIKRIKHELLKMANCSFYRGKDFPKEQLSPTTERTSEELQWASKEKNVKSLEKETRISSRNDHIPSNRAAGIKTAFYAFMSSWEKSPGQHHTLIFDTVLTNVNNAYNKYTGAFNVPSPGVYVFTFSARMHAQHFCAFEIIKNSDIVGTFMAELDNNPEQITLTGIVVINANQGDVVYVRTHATHSCRAIIASDVNGRSTFAGWSL